MNPALFNFQTTMANEIELIQAQWVDINLVDFNEGQIDGVPSNPRTIDPIDLANLKKSLQDNPEMLGMRELLVYPVAGRYVVIGGNMRLRAMRELGYDAAPCKVLPTQTDTDTLRAIIIKDNVQKGEWSWQDLANDWSAEELQGWGVELPEFIQDEEPNADELTADGEDKPHSVKLTFPNQTEMNKFRDAYENIIKDEFNVAISISGGKL